MEDYGETETQVVELITHSPRTQEKDDIHELHEDARKSSEIVTLFPETDSAS